MAVRKPVRAVKTATKPAVKVAKPPKLLDEGDTVEYSMTVQFKHARKGDYWIKMGASTAVRPGETEEDAKDRVVAFVVDGIEDQITELKE